MIQEIHAFYRPDLGLLPRDKDRLRPVLHLHPKNHVTVVTDCTGRHRLGEYISWSIRGSLTSEVVPRSNSYTRRDGVNAALGLGGALALLLSFSRIFLKSCDIPKHFIEGVSEAIKESSLLVIKYESCFRLLLKPVKKVLIPEFQDSKGILLLLSREWRYLIVSWNTEKVFWRSDAMGCQSTFSCLRTLSDAKFTGSDREVQTGWMRMCHMHFCSLLSVAYGPCSFPSPIPMPLTSLCRFICSFWLRMHR